MTKSLDSDRPLYIALEFHDEVAGEVSITFPSEHELINHKPGDENRHRGRSLISLEGEGTHRAEARLMRGFQVASEPMRVRIELEPSSDATEEDSVTLTRIHVFQQWQAATEGLPIGYTAEDRQVKQFVFDTANLKTDPPTAVYLLAEDAERNYSEPGVAHGETFHTFVNRP